MRVLIADDDPNIRLLVSITLSLAKIEVAEAADGDEAWLRLCEVRPDVAILDVQMPGRTGFALARAIKATPALAATKVIILSALSQETDRQRGYEAGAELFLTKPFSPVELQMVVEQAPAPDPTPPADFHALSNAQINDAWDGKIAVKDALTKAQEQVNALLEKNGG